MSYCVAHKKGKAMATKRVSPRKSITLAPEMWEWLEKKALAEEGNLSLTLRKLLREVMITKADQAAEASHGSVVQQANGKKVVQKAKSSKSTR